MTRGVDRNDVVGDSIIFRDEKELLKEEGKYEYGFPAI